MTHFRSNPILLKGVNNVRDYGGYLTQYGTIKPKRLIRGTHLHHLALDQYQYFESGYRIKHIIDLRTEKERSENQNPSFSQIKEYPFNLLGQSTSLSADPKEMIELILKNPHPQDYLFNLYQDFITLQSATDIYRKIFDILLNEENNAVYWHCTAGKDRTGIVGALILSALGADYSTIMQDYLLSNVYRKEENQQILDHCRAIGLEEKVLNAVQFVLTVEKEYLDSSLKTITQQYGGIDHYLTRVIQLTSNEKERLRELYLDQ